MHIGPILEIDPIPGLFFNVYYAISKARLRFCQRAMLTSLTNSQMGKAISATAMTIAIKLGVVV